MIEQYLGFIPLALMLGLQAGSALLDSQADKKVDKAQAAYRRAEEGRQDQFRDQARESYNKFLESQALDDQLRKEAEQTDKTQKIFVDNVDQKRFSELLPGQGNASATVKTDIVNSGAKGLANALQQAKAKGRLNAFGNVQLGNQIDLGRTKQGIGQIGVSASNSAGILPTELEAAKSKGSGLRALAGLLRGGSNLIGLSGMGAGGGFGMDRVVDNVGYGMNKLGFGNQAYTMLDKADGWWGGE